MEDVVWNREVWTSLVRRVSRRSGDASQAEDHLHSAFLRLELYRDTRTVANPVAYLLQTAVNIAVDDRRRRRFVSSEPVDAFQHELADPYPLQDEVLAMRTRLRRVESGLARLKPRSREIFLLHRVHGLRFREIADRMGISQSAVEKHMLKTTLFLARWMDRQ
jgi:RNA polymerase sigma-70 factor (ECF subfamily)